MKKVKEMKNAKKRDPVAFGAAGSIFLVMGYFLLLTVLNSFDHAIDQFFTLWYWIIILAAGFGTQIGLYVHVKNNMCANTGETAGMAASGGISGASMLGCCAHHITDIAPILGLSAASLFLSRYQTSFMMLGIFSNLVGITMMLSAIQKHGLFNKKGLFGTLFKYDMRFIRNAVIAVAFIAVAASFYSSYVSTSALSDARTLSLAEKADNQNAVSISVKPTNFSFDNPVKLSITLTTHQGSLDYDLTKVSVLEDANGNTYQPLSWDGSPPGGHHRNGVLTFPALKGKTSSMTLIIKGIYDVPERTFIWQLEQ